MSVQLLRTFEAMVCKRFVALFLAFSLRGLGSLGVEDGTPEGRGHLVKTYKRWGPDFHVGFDIQIKPKANWTGSVWCGILLLTTGLDGRPRIPGVWLHKSNRAEYAAYLVVQMEVNGTIHTKYHGLRGYDYIRVELYQKYGALKMTVDDERVWWNEVLTVDLRWEDVKFWLPSPWSVPTEDVDLHF